MQRFKQIGLATILGMLAALVQAHPLISPYEGSELRSEDTEAFSEYPRITGFADRVVKTEPLQGKLTRIRYENPKDRSTLEILTNYRQALESQGFTVDFDCSGRANCGTTAKPSWSAINGMNLGAGGDVRYFTGRLNYGDAQAYVSVGVAPQTTLIHILEAAAMETGLVVADAAALANGLARDGRIRVDGIFFDTGRATLKAESAPALEQVAKLLREQAQLQLYVVGHTDSQGQFQQNMSLSRARAEAVMQALVRDYGISASRLEAHGVGPLVPASTNRQEGGRSQNRRVEIVER